MSLPTAASTAKVPRGGGRQWQPIGGPWGPGSPRPPLFFSSMQHSILDDRLAERGGTDGRSTCPFRWPCSGKHVPSARPYWVPTGGAVVLPLVIWGHPGRPGHPGPRALHNDDGRGRLIGHGSASSRRPAQSPQYSPQLCYSRRAAIEVAIRLSVQWPAAAACRATAAVVVPGALSRPANCQRRGAAPHRARLCCPAFCFACTRYNRETCASLGCALLVRDPLPCPARPPPVSLGVYARWHWLAGSRQAVALAVAVATETECVPKRPSRPVTLLSSHTSECLAIHTPAADS